MELARLKTITLASLILLVLLLGALFQFQPDVRRVGLELLGDERKNDVIALYSELTARWAATADLEPIAHADMNPYGVNVFLEQEVEEAKIRRSLELVRDAGFKWVKQQVLWYEIERPTKGQHYDEKNKVPNTWAKYDRIVDLCQEYGLNLIARLDTSPEWARPGNPKLETPPDNFEDYGDFVYEIVSRYKGKVRYYQIWNEPNWSFEWGNRDIDAAEFVELLKIAYRRAKEADPDVVIIAPALAPTTEESPKAFNDLKYLQRMYELGAKDYFDIMSANPYGLRSGPYDRRLDLEQDVNFSRPVLVRELMVAYGDVHKPIWASEMGWCALPPDYPEWPQYGRVTREQQARYTVQALQRAQREWPWMGVMNLWYLRTVHDVNTNQQKHYFSIIGNDFSPYPIYWAVRDLATSPPVVEYGYRQESHWALKYSGQWRETRDERASLGGARIGETPGDSVTFAFRGTDLSLVVACGPEAGALEVKIDGLPANGLEKRDGSGYLDLYSPTEVCQRKAVVASGLSDGLHHAEIVVSANKNEASLGHRVVLDGVIVDRRVTSLRGKVKIALAGLGAIAVALAMVILGRRVWPRIQH
ncbi:MAG: cellulase family glycosylhydrolase [Chloroflexota bacterium]